jgi:hypothetical protein
MLSRRFALFPLFVFFFAIAGAAQSGDFTIVVLPDTQFYSASYPQIFNQQTQWIRDNASALNIKLVLGEGDIVNGGGEISQWQNADAAMKTLDGAVPYMSVIGNHDYDQNDPSKRTPSTVNFNNYFGPNRYAGQSWYQGTFTPGSNENFYGFFTFGGTTFLVIALEFMPRSTVLDWANNLVAANPDKEVILLTHAYEYYDNTRMGRCDQWSKDAFNVSADNDGNDMWDKLVRKHKNISLVLNGHVTAGDGTGRRTDLGDNGNLVNQVLADYQTLPNGGNGWLRIMTFHPSTNTIDVKTYSPFLNAYLTDAENQFTLTWHAQGGFVGQPGAIDGRVRSAIDCHDISGATVSAGGVSTTTDSSGLYNLAVSAATRVSVKVAASGWISQTASMNVYPGVGTQGEFFIATGGQLNGTVVDANGSPISGVTVTANGGYAPTSLTMSTDPLGKFASGWISTGTYTVAASATGFTSASTSATLTPGQTTNVSLTLSGGSPPPATTGAIAGTVTSAVDGRALASATVTAAGQSALTDSSGTYRITGVAPGTYTVSASLSGWQTNSTTVAVTSGTTSTANIQLATTGRITGTIKTSSGARVSGATVTFSGGVIPNTTSVFTNSAGNYTSAWIPVGSYTVTVTKSGLTTRTGTATVTPGGKYVLNFTM